MDNFMVVKVADFREWLKKAAIDWSRVTDKTSLYLVIDDLGNSGVDVNVTVLYEDGKAYDKQTLLPGPPHDYLGDFGMEVRLKKLMDIVDKATLEMFMFDGERDVICEYTPEPEHKL